MLPTRYRFENAELFGAATTKAKAGSQEAFRYVDYTLPLVFARAARDAGVERSRSCSHWSRNRLAVFLSEVRARSLFAKLPSGAFSSAGIAGSALTLRTSAAGSAASISWHWIAVNTARTGR